MRKVMLALGIAVSIGLFVLLAWWALSGWSGAFDRQISDMLRGHMAPLMRGLTILGNGPPGLVLCFAMTWAAWRRAEDRSALAMVSTIMFAETVTAFVKKVLHRPRPVFFDVATVPGFSLPSGHAVSSMTLVGMAALIAIRLWPHRRVPVVIAAALFITGISVSRVALGAHWPTDILAGWCLGLAVVCAGALVMGPRASRPQAP